MSLDFFIFHAVKTKCQYWHFCALWKNPTTTVPLVVLRSQSGKIVTNGDYQFCVFFIGWSEMRYFILSAYKILGLTFTNDWRHRRIHYWTSSVSWWTRRNKTSRWRKLICYEQTYCFIWLAVHSYLIPLRQETFPLGGVDVAKLKQIFITLSELTFVLSDGQLALGSLKLINIDLLMENKSPTDLPMSNWYLLCCPPSPQM